MPGYAESSQAMSNTGETLRGRIPLRLFDGIPQGSPLREGTRNGTFTDMGIIGRVEVINGPSASEGIGAAGGIINYISKVPTREGSETTFTTRYQTQGHDDSEGWKIGLTFAAKQDAYDVLLSASYIDRGISYDGNGRRIGMNTSGSLADSTSKNLFVKGGFNFGAANEQRLQATYSRFKIAGKGNYIQILGCRGPDDDPPCAVPRTNTSEKGHIFGSKDAFNDFKQYSLAYSHSNFFGGTLEINAYKADQAMRYLPENSSDKQDPLIAPLNTLFDQSEIDSHKKGIRTSWTRSDLFNVAGLELHTGIDFGRRQGTAAAGADQTPVGAADELQEHGTVRAAVLGRRPGDPERRLSAARTTSSPSTATPPPTTATACSSRAAASSTPKNLKNFGAIWRIDNEWSLFAAYSEGFTLPNIGIPLRNINVPGQSVSRIRDLGAIIYKNNELGFNWRGEHAAFGATHYISKSPFGASLAIDPTSNDFILTRAPVRIEGTEATGEWRFDEKWKVTGLYSHIRGKTAFWSDDPAGRFAAGKLVKPMGVLDINPDKFAAAVTWKFLPNADATLGFTTLLDRHISGSDTRAFDGRTFSYDEQTHGYTLFDLGVNYDMQRYGKLSLGVENLFDKQYILSWSQLAGYQNYWAGRGRMTSVTYTITF